ncbi:arogenate dehydrogenase 1, chloroplastic isoform X4 [Hevea brasiliensis]|uniref:arogenate dehydrogenase 1, chloroplastic isoform X4 n=1 Tax=Hevea brasiliensis TaxID=3981 RepID=UPI0025EB73AF|nr:arogenate dehydrogenase 1, chloroplastic isoform X4 [Hevea brasiliensis]
MSTSSSCQSSTLKLGIIGFGPFAQFLAKTMIKQGHTLRATSRSDHSQLCQDLGISYFRDAITFLEADNDVILICTSILSLPEVLKSMPLHGLKRQTLFADVLSVKEYPRDLLLKGCRMLEMSCEEHDKMAARSQFLTHTIGRVLSEMEIKSTPISTKGFESLVQLKEGTVKDSFDLFSGLFLCNRFAKEELKNLEISFEKVKLKLLDMMNVRQDINDSNL